jgi:outer membrane protein
MNVKLRYAGVLAVLAVISLASIAGAQAQGGAAASAAPKIATLNVRGAILGTAEGQVAQAQLIAQFTPKQTELQNGQKQIEDLQRRLSEGARTLSDDEKAKLQRQGEALSRRLQRLTEDLNEESNNAQGEIVDTIGRKMLDVLDRFARENGYAVVLDTSAQGSAVVYGWSQIDITQDIVRLYDQAYPVKAAGSASKPAASAPAPKPAAPAPAASAPAPKPAAPAPAPKPAAPSKRP